MENKDESIKKNISTNISKFREKSGMNQKELARQLGVTPSRVSNWEQGANCPTIDILFEVCEILKVSINDIYGIYPDSNIMLTYDEQNHIEKYRALDDTGRQHIDTMMSWETERVFLQTIHIENEEKEDEVPVYIMSYYQRLASAGSGEYLFDDIPTDTIEVPITKQSEQADFVIGVNGESMEPDFHDGERLYIQKVRELTLGDTGIFTLGNECFVKELGDKGLISKNPNYDEIPGTEDVRLIGRVLGKVED